MFSDTYDAYIKSISKFTPLTKEDEIAICIKIQEGDKTAREKLINHNLKLVVKIAYSYHNYYDIMDIIQIGNVGLIKAVDSFDINMGYNFSTFAFSYVSKYIMGRLQDTVNGQVHIPTSAFWEILRFKKTYEALSTEYEIPTVEMMCKETGFSPEKVKRYMAFDINCLSLDLVNEQGDCFADCIEDDSNIAKEIEDKAIINDTINKIFSILKPREREIFTMYYGFGCKSKTMDEIGECLNLTKQRVSQIIETAKLKLRKKPELIQMVNLIYND